MSNVSHGKYNPAPNCIPNKCFWQGQSFYYTASIHSVLCLNKYCKGE